MSLGRRGAGPRSAEGAVNASSPVDLAAGRARPRALWLMVSAAAVDETVADLVPQIDAGDTLIDGGTGE